MKCKTLLCLFLLLGGLFNAAQADNYYYDQRLTLSDISDGKLVALEGASTTSALGHYLSGITVKADGFDNTCVFRLVQNTSATDGTTTYFLQQVSSGKFIGGSATATNQRGSLSLVDDQTNALPFVIQSSSTTSTNPAAADGTKGWDENSITFCYQASSTVGFYLANRFGDSGDAKFWIWKDTNAWNLYSVTTEASVVDDGYYRIVNTSADFTTDGRKPIVWYSLDSDHKIGWQRFNSDSPYQIFKITKNGDNYDIQSLSSGEYVDANVDAKEGNVQTLTSGYRHQVLAYQGGGKFKISSTKDNVAYHPKGHNKGASDQNVLITWGDVSDHGTWYLRPVSADSIDFYTQQKQLDVKLNSLLPIIEDSLANALVVTKTGDGLITAASQLSTNAQESKEGSLANLIDGSFDTFFHSSWSQGIGAYHYLQVNLNDNPVDHFMFYYKGRNDNYVENRVYPVWVRIYGSNDASNWTVVADLKNGFPSSSVTPANSDYYSPAIVADQKYQYFRFEVRATAVGRLDPSEYPYFSLSAFQMYDYTVDNAKSTYVYVPGMADRYKALKKALIDGRVDHEAGAASALFSAAQTAYNNFVDYGVPTQKVTIGTLGYASICFNYNAVVPAGVKVYYATQLGADKVVCAELTGGIIPARTPVLLHAEAGTYTFEPDWTSSVQAVTGNLFQASPNKVTTQQDGKTYYALAAKRGSTSEIVLKQVASGLSIPAGRVDLTVDASAGSKELLYFSFGEVSGIRNAVNAGNDRNIIYDLQGRRVAKPEKGIYIVGGKKVYVK